MIRPCNEVNIPEIFKTVRKRKKMTQDKLGKRLGVSCKTISAYERNEIKPPLDTFLRFLYVAGYRIELVKDVFQTPRKLELD